MSMWHACSVCVHSVMEPHGKVLCPYDMTAQACEHYMPDPRSTNVDCDRCFRHNECVALNGGHVSMCKFFLSEADFPDAVRRPSSRWSRLTFKE